MYPNWMALAWERTAGRETAMRWRRERGRLCVPHIAVKAAVTVENMKDEHNNDMMNFEMVPEEGLGAETVHEE